MSDEKGGRGRPAGGSRRPRGAGEAARTIPEIIRADEFERQRSRWRTRAKRPRRSPGRGTRWPPNSAPPRRPWPRSGPGSRAGTRPPRRRGGDPTPPLRSCRAGGRTRTSPERGAAGRARGTAGHPRGTGRGQRPARPGQRAAGARGGGAHGRAGGGQRGAARKRAPPAHGVRERHRLCDLHPRPGRPGDELEPRRGAVLPAAGGRGPRPHHGGHVHARGPRRGPARTRDVPRRRARPRRGRPLAPAGGRRPLLRQRRHDAVGGRGGPVAELPEDPA